MRVKFLKPSTAYGFAYREGNEVDINEKKHFEALKAMYENGVIEIKGKHPFDKTEKAVAKDNTEKR